MITTTYTSKTKEDAVTEALTSLNTTKENLIVTVIDEKNGLIKKSTTIEVITYNDLINEIKAIINNILNLMDIHANLELRRRENQIKVTIYSDNNAILIGKGGKNMRALQTIIRTIIDNKIKEHISIIIDVENYKEKRNHSIEVMATKVAKEVAITKVDAKLESMNSYERRLVHSILADNPNVYTESIGEEPNRCVVIKAKE